MRKIIYCLFMSLVVVGLIFVSAHIEASTAAAPKPTSVAVKKKVPAATAAPTLTYEKFDGAGDISAQIEISHRSTALVCITRFPDGSCMMGCVNTNIEATRINPDGTQTRVTCTEECVRDGLVCDCTIDSEDCH